MTTSEPNVRVTYGEREWHGDDAVRIIWISAILSIAVAALTVLASVGGAWWWFAG